MFFNNIDIDIILYLLINRVGRTARAGKAGRSIAFVTQYDLEAYQRLETLICKKLPQVNNWEVKCSIHKRICT